jgi:hypothetical protein
MATYKSTNPAALAVLQQHADDVTALRDKGKAFAERFGANDTFVTQNSVSSGYSIAGFTFSPPKDTTLWTKPDRELLGAQRPRASLRAGTAVQRQMLKDLNAEWSAYYPDGNASWKPVLEALGTDWGAAFLGGLQLFEHDGVIYVLTGARPALCEEILGSEFDAARAAYDKEQRSGGAKA